MRVVQSDSDECTLTVVPVTDSQEVCLLKTDNTREDEVPLCITVHKTSSDWGIKGILQKVHTEIGKALMTSSSNMDAIAFK